MMRHTRYLGIAILVASSIALTSQPLALPALSEVGRVEGSERPRVQGSAPSERPRVEGRRAQFLDMFARAYFPGRTAQIMIVPREGDIITRPDPALLYMHGSPWPYDTEIPLFFVGPQIAPGVHTVPARQQDVAVTLAAALGATMPPTVTGRVLPVLRANAQPPRAVLLVSLDGMRRDYFDRHAKDIPTLTRLRGRGAWFRNARIDYLPTNTASGHSTISSGTDPRVHGVNGNNLYDRVQRARQDMYQGFNPRVLNALTLGDVWQLQTAGRGLVIAQGSNATASTALAGHGACQLNGTRIVHAGYDETSGLWKTNAECFSQPAEIAQFNAKTVWPADGLWMGHKIDSASEIRRSGLFPRFEADVFTTLIESQPIGKDDVPDLLLLNLKGADYVGHKHGPGSPELVATLGEIDRQLARILAALEAKVGGEYLLAVTADHGMPAEPADKSRRRVAGDVVNLLHAKFDAEGKTLVTYYEPENAQIFIDADRLRALKLTLKDIAAFLEAQPFIYAAFTEDEVRRRAERLPH